MDMSDNRIKIHNWPSDSDPITNDTPLIRYMKLETFLLLLLGDQIFIPTLELLQQADRSEGHVPFMRASPYHERMWSILGPHKEWLLKAAKNPEIPPVEDKVRELHERALVEQSWRKELAMRRCVSCWNRSTEQINFMWRIYGDRGVAVFSTVGRIREALADAGAEGIVSPVLYIPCDDTIPRSDFNLLNQNCERAYLFKDSSYRPEQEVRFVLKVDPLQAGISNGILIKAPAKIIIDRVYLSPQIPSAEEWNIKELVYEKRFSRSFFSPGKKPTPASLAVESDLLPGIFPDLD